jgi:phosphate transport system substrate-binding protein
MKVLGVVGATIIFILSASVLRGTPAAPQDAHSARTAEAQRVIRIWTFRPAQSELNELDVLLHRLEGDYSSDHPDTNFVNLPNGNDSALGGVYMGAADIALMSRDPSYIELDGYQQVIAGQKPFIETVMRGRSRAGRSISALVIVVNRRNPLRRISQSQLKSIFSGQCDRTGYHRPTWGPVGLTGSWAARPLRIYGFGIDTVEAQVFRQVALNGNRRWSCAYREVRDSRSLSAAEQIGRTVEQDPNAIGVTTMSAVSGDTTIIPIVGRDGRDKMPDDQSLASGEYPLGRTVVAAARADAIGKPDQNIRGFLDYLVSARAAKLIATSREYVAAINTLDGKGGE